MLFYLIGSFIFGIAASFIAYGKGRNSLGWLVAGLVIGPFALIAALLPPRPRAGRFHRCANCAEVISNEARVCRYCGAVVQEAAEG
jgi:hypothetical protein